MTKNNKPRTIGAIALYPRSDTSWYFMSLETGKRLHRYQWTVLPATEDVANRINELEKRQNQPEVSENFFLVGMVTQKPLLKQIRYHSKNLKSHTTLMALAQTIC